MNLNTTENKKADKIFLGGIIHTMDDNNPVVEAVACSHGKIIAAGNLSLVNELSNDDTEIIDLYGETSPRCFLCKQTGKCTLY